MNATRNRTIGTSKAIKSAMAAVLVGWMAAFSWTSFAHPLGQGNCLPRYHTWRDATFELRDAKADLATYIENMNAAAEKNNVSLTAFWALVVVLKQMQITNYYEPRVDAAWQVFLACDHY